MSMRDGTSQKDRMAPALESGYVGVDEMRLEDLLSMSADFSRLLTYYNLKNEPQGDWAAFFASDEAVILALIQTLDLKKAESDFYAFMKAAPWGMGRKKFLSQGEAWKKIPNYRLAKKIDGWYCETKQPASEAGRTLNQQIRVDIESELGTARRGLKIFLEQYGEVVSQGFQQDFQADWFDGNASLSVPSPLDAFGTIEGFLKSNFYLFYNAVLSLKDASNRLLTLSLKSKTHSPSIGLYIAFLQLFQRAQQKLNRFPQRHLDFYYNAILKVQVRPRVPDSTYLIFHSTMEGKAVFIKEGTPFTAGSDALHQDIIYTADNDLVVDRSEIVSLRTLYFARNPLSSPENSLGYLSAAKEHEIPLLEGNEESNALPGEKDRRSWPLFGAPKNDAEQRQYQDTSFGFAVASPVLFLKEGEREIDLSIKMTCPLSEIDDASNCVQTLNDVLETLLGKMKQDAGDLKPVTEGEKQAFFFKVFRQIFRIDLTTETGWLEVEDYFPTGHLLDKSCEKDLLKIRFCLSSDADPIAAYAPELHGGSYETDLPLLRLVINPSAYLFPYSFLMHFIVTEVKIEVTVKEVRDLLLYNNLGRLDPNTPFNPFGPLPAVGSYFMIGNSEMARKQLTGFEVNIEWGDLPRDQEGFEAYYGAYPETYDNDVFKVGMTTLSRGYWHPISEDAQPITALFQSERCGHKKGGTPLIDKNRRLSCDTIVAFFKPIQSSALRKPFAYTPEVKGGFFKFTLTEPEMAFGHKAYPSLLTKVLTSNARLKLPKLFKSVPNAPYTPLVNRISINYKAESKLSLKRSGGTQKNAFNENFFHIHPFGHESVSSESYRHIHLLPRYASEGYLFIGLSDAPSSDVLTLFFHMREDATPETGTMPSRFTWSYLARNRWYKLNASQVISDTTSGFLTSGIVTLKIPKNIEQGNTIMSGDLFWLRLSVPENPESLCSVYAIHTQAVKVTWQFREGAPTHHEEKLPMGTIKSSVKSIPGIGEVNQIVDSFDGRPSEKANHIKKRISERLKHKNRATTPWDYEHLILEAFPEIFKVKCFNNMVSAEEPVDRIRPGQILIVVIPQPLNRLSEMPYPMVNGAVLKEIRDFAKKRASPFARISVRNPAYEKIQVRCTVQLKKGQLIGHYIDLLNREISDYLSPWSESGYRVGFGWCIRRYELEAYIRNRPYIEYVTNFSMLHITKIGKGHYDLFDTVDGHGGIDNAEEIRPLFPWSLAMPFKRHFIETIDKVVPITPEVTGIEELEIGSTFIIT